VLVRWRRDHGLTFSGNHDITLDSDFYAQYGTYFHNQTPQDTTKCQELLGKSSSIIWLKHEAAVVSLSSSSGPHTTFKIFGSPFSPAKGMWAFGYGPDEGPNIWDRIPLDSDIVVTHTPPKYHCDETKERRAAGCEALRMALWRIRPRLAICGHVHEGRGAERIRWDLDVSNIKYKELGVERWEDPGLGNKKTSLLNISSKSKAPIQNDGSVGNWKSDEDILASVPSSLPLQLSPSRQDTKQPSRSSKRSPSRSPERTVDQGISRVTSGLLAVPPEVLASATVGQGGIPPSKRCDLEALSGRMGRRETFVINAAMMASSWPHGLGGRKYNKPIVVDLDLPTW
jgi:hypothetical protein